MANIEIQGYKPFIFDSTKTTRGGTRFYINESLQINVRDDVKFKSPGNIESAFIELMFPSTKNFIIGCICRHPSSSISIHHFTSDYIEPLLGKMCSLMGDFNIDLLKSDTMKI